MGKFGKSRLTQMIPRIVQDYSNEKLCMVMNFSTKSMVPVKI